MSTLCEPLVGYSKAYHKSYTLFDEIVETDENDIRVIELFAGVGGFRVGLE